MSLDPFFGATNHAGIKWYSSEKPLVLWTLNGSLPKIWFFKTLESDREVENQGVKEPVCWENPIKFQGYRLGKAISTLGSRKETYIHQGRDWPTSKFFKSKLSIKSPEPAFLWISESPHPCPGTHRMPPASRQIVYAGARAINHAVTKFIQSLAISIVRRIMDEKICCRFEKSVTIHSGWDHWAWHGYRDSDGYVFFIK